MLQLWTWSQIDSLVVSTGMLWSGIITGIHLVIRKEANFWFRLIRREIPPTVNQCEIRMQSVFPPAGGKTDTGPPPLRNPRKIKMANKNTPDGLLINEFHWEHLREVRGWVAGWWCTGALRPRPVESIDFYARWFLISVCEVGGKRVTRLGLKHYNAFFTCILSRLLTATY